MSGILVVHLDKMTKQKTGGQHERAGIDMAPCFDRQYYILECENNDNYPLLEWDDDRNDSDGGELADMEPLVVDDTINLILGEPIPDNPVLVDYHYLPPDVFSDKVANVLAAMKLYQTQLFPARIHHAGKVTAGYQILHVYNEIQCMHMERSIYRKRTVSYAVEKLSLNEEVLSSIEESQRFVFLLEESPDKKLYHQKVVDSIMQVNPVGLRFIRLDEWDIGSAFR